MKAMAQKLLVLNPTLEQMHWQTQLRLAGVLSCKPCGLSNTSSNSPSAMEEDQAHIFLFMW